MHNLLIRSVEYYLRIQLSHDFRDRIHPISLKYKTNGVKKFFKDVNDTLSPSDIEDIESYLSPMFDYLNTNLEILMSTIDEDLAYAVVLGVWNRFVMDAEAMIVPSLGEDPKERKPWDERRFQFFKKYIEVFIIKTHSYKIAADFFLVDGEGLDLSSLHTEAYISLLHTMKHYFDTPEMLTKIYESGEEADWVLKLIKMRGGRYYIDEALKKQCTQ